VFWQTRAQGSCLYPLFAVVIIVHNGRDLVQAKLENLIDQTYAGFFRIYLACDGCDDDTEQLARQFPKVKVVSFHPRSGKSATLNKVISEVEEEIVVFTDIRQQFDEDAVHQLVANFADDRIGVVSGQYTMSGDASGGMEGVGLYWKIETFLRKNEARLYSTVGATGSIYAIRKSIWQSIPDDALIDDVSIPLKINSQGYRTIFEPAAQARDHYAVSWEHEKIRKTRTMAGNFQIALHPGSYGNPYQGRLFFQYMSHKFLRLLVPGFLFIVLLSNLLLREGVFYNEFFFFQAACYLLGFLGLLFGNTFRSIPLIGIPGTFLLLNFSVLSGAWYFLTSKGKTGWNNVPDDA